MPKTKTPKVDSDSESDPDQEIPVSNLAGSLKTIDVADAHVPPTIKQIINLISKTEKETEAIKCDPSKLSVVQLREKFHAHRDWFAAFTSLIATAETRANDIYASLDSIHQAFLKASNPSTKPAEEIKPKKSKKHVVSSDDDEDDVSDEEPQVEEEKPKKKKNSDAKKEKTKEAPVEEEAPPKKEKAKAKAKDKEEEKPKKKKADNADNKKSKHEEDEDEEEAPKEEKKKVEKKKKKEKEKE